MPVSLPVPTKNPGDVLTSALWNSSVRDNINKLLNQGHRVLTVAQFAALAAPEGTKGTVAPDEVYLEVDAANGIQWHLAYESGEATYKWRFIGGPPLVSQVATSETTSSAAYVALATAGPSVALPRAGDYDVEIGAKLGGSNTPNVWMSYDVGAAAAVDADGVGVAANAFATVSVWRKQRKTALTSVTLTAKYRAASGLAETFLNRVMAVTPARIRHDA